MRAKAAIGLVVGAIGGVLILTATFATPGCGGSSSSCAVGSEGCSCTAGGTCDTGLSCLSKRCVNAGATAGTSGGGSTGTAGTGGSVGSAGTGGSTGSAGTGGSTTAEAMCNTFTAYCDKINECAPLVVKLSYGSVEECRTRFAIQCKDAVKAPDSGLTANALAACGTALATATCEDVLYRKVAACNIVGGRSNGMACGTGAQCSSTYCAQSNAACGVCAALVGAGSACMVDDDCLAGLVCGNDAHCVTPAAAGSICNDNQPCIYGTYCRNGSCANGATAAGATCEGALATSCNILKGVYCDSTVAKCANIAFAANGDPCGIVSAKFTYCSKGTCIYADAVSTQGICGALAADGATCDATTFCEAPAICSSGKCKLPSSAACL